MKYVYLTLNWGFGVLFLLIGLLTFVGSFFAGLCIIAIAAFLLPPVRNFTYSKTNKELPTGVRAVIISALLIASPFFIAQTSYNKVKESSAQHTRHVKESENKLKQNNIEYFNNNRSEILAKIKTELDSQNHKKVLSLSKRYIDSGDQDLIKYNQIAKMAIDEFNKEIKDLLAVGKKIPYKKWEQWGFPDTLEGTSNTYWIAYIPKINISFVSEKKTDTIIFSGIGKSSAQNFIKERDKKRKEQIESQFSAWDGSHRNITERIKNALNDPGSYEHVETLYYDRKDHLIVRTKFRGKNAFGAKVLQAVMAKVSLDGEIIEIQEVPLQ